MLSPRVGEHIEVGFQQEDMVIQGTGFSHKGPGTIGSENCDFQNYESEVSNNHLSSNKQ